MGTTHILRASPSSSLHLGMHGWREEEDEESDIRSQTDTTGAASEFQSGLGRDLIPPSRRTGRNRGGE